MAQAQRQSQMQIKVLRIGVVKDGKIVQERLIKAGEPVTIGEGAKNTFTTPLPSVGKRFTLFHPVRTGVYEMHFTDAVKGKISHQGAVKSLKQLATDGAASDKGGHFAIELDDDSRGKVGIDDITVLFQFVPPPPEPLRAANMDFRPKLIEDDDPVFYGFLGLFTALAAVWIVYVSTTEPRDGVSLDEIPDRFTEVVMAPEPPDAPEIEEREIDEDGMAMEQEKKKAEEKVEEAEPKEKKEMSEAEKAAAEEKRRQEMEKRVMEESKLLMAIIGTRGESSADGRVEDLFSNSDFAGQDLDAALANVSGADVASGAKLEAKSGKGGKRGDADIGDLKGADAGSASVGGGPSTKVTGSLQLGQEDAMLEEGDAGSIQSVVRKNNGQVIFCYEKELKVDPTIQGRVDISFTINKGRVVSASVFSNTTGSSSLGSCITGKVRLWRFDEGITGEVVYPFILTPGG